MNVPGFTDQQELTRDEATVAIALNLNLRKEDWIFTPMKKAEWMPPSLPAAITSAHFSVFDWLGIVKCPAFSLMYHRDNQACRIRYMIVYTPRADFATADLLGLPCVWTEERKSPAQTAYACIANGEEVYTVRSPCFDKTEDYWQRVAFALIREIRIACRLD